MVYGPGDQIMVYKRRVSIAGLMSVVLVTSLGLAALRSGNQEWAGATMLVACGLLSLGVIGAACRAGTERVWWLGFSIIGWGYLLLIFTEPYTSLHLPTTTLLEILRPADVQGGGGVVRWGLTGHMFLPGVSPHSAYSQAGHSLFSLGFATVGGLLALFLFRGRVVRSEVVVGPIPVVRVPRRWWGWSRVIAPAALVAGTVVALAGLRRAPWLSCAATMYVTWGLLGLAAVGAICHPGRARAAWLGAALFGIGYMGLMFGRDPDRPNWPQAGTDLLLRVLRPSWCINNEPPPPTAGAAVINVWIREVLERPITLRYPEETPLADVLKAIRAATRGPDGRGPVFYVDQIGLQEAEKSMASPVTIDIEDVPLRTILPLILTQLDLKYGIQDGMVYITSDKVDEDFPRSIGVDPYLSVGHCLLALIAAGLGAVLSRWFCTPRDEPAARSMSI
jgi:hypothetical protein